jgi:hypothetical protein
MRNMLRTLSPDEADWTVVTASIASTLGMPAAILSLGDRPLALVDTGIPLADALDAAPSLGPWRQKLALLSSGATLWIPLSGRLPSSGGDAAFWALADALDALASEDIASSSRCAIPQSPVQEIAPVPFPLVLPFAAARRSIAALRELAESTMAGVRSP